MNQYRLRAYIYLILVAAIWGAAGPIIKFTLGGIDPLPFLAYRFTISAFISLIYFGIKGVHVPKSEKNLPLILIYGFLAYSLALGALFTGLDKSTALDLTIIATIGPLLVTLGGALFFKDHITHREKIGITIVLVGALINSFAPFFSNGSGARFTGNLFIFAFLLFDTSSYLLAKKITRLKVKSFTLTNIGFIIGALTIIPFSFLMHGYQNVTSQIINLPFKYHLGIWYMAVLSGTTAYFLQVRGQKTIEVSEAALFAYLQPIFAIPLAVFWLGESITSTFLVGAILIAIGIIVAEHKKKRYN